jgi:hypothetical protein
MISLLPFVIPMSGLVPSVPRGFQTDTNRGKKFEVSKRLLVEVGETLVAVKSEQGITLVETWRFDGTSWFNRNTARREVTIPKR